MLRKALMKTRPSCSSASQFGLQEWLIQREELSYDYGLIIDERYTPKLKAEYPCWCGAPKCRGTLLAPKRGR